MPACTGARVSVDDNGKELVVYLSGGCGPSFSIKTIHISCKSDICLGPHHRHGGIIVYGRNGETDW